MTAVSGCSNSYIQYTPLWDSSTDPLPLKIASATAAVFINIATFFANIGIGLCSAIGSLFSSTSEPDGIELRQPPYNPAYILPSAPFEASSITPSAPPWDPAWGPFPS